MKSSINNLCIKLKDIFKASFWRRPGILAVAPLMAMNFNYGFENNNIFAYDESQNYALDFNRLRFEGNMEHKENKALQGKVIIDNKTLGKVTQNYIENDLDIYRAYLEYAGEKHLVVVGRQRVPFGVGRIWNPIDVFNPIDSYSIEPAERRGTEALRYEYAMNDLSNFDITVSRDKRAARIKGFLKFADIALVGEADDDRDEDILGYELAGELFDTKIEIRSEGGSFRNRTTGKRYTEFIVGADYSFKNSLSILGEYRYNDISGRDYLGASLSYKLTPLTDLSLLTIVQLNDKSFFASPAVDYSLGDEMTIRAGALFYEGGGLDEFGNDPDVFYLNFYIHF